MSDQAAASAAKTRRKAQRRREDLRFRIYGATALFFTAGILALILGTILVQSLATVRIWVVSVEVVRDIPVNRSLKLLFDDPAEMADSRRFFAQLLPGPASGLPDADIFPEGTRSNCYPIRSEFADYLDGRVLDEQEYELDLSLLEPGETGKMFIATANLPSALRDWLNANETTPVRLILINGREAFRAVGRTRAGVSFERLAALRTDVLLEETGKASAFHIRNTADQEVLSDTDIARMRLLQVAGILSKGWNSPLVSRSNSSDPERAGIAAAFVGTILSMTVAIAVAIPLGMVGAVYLHEFAPRNAFFSVIDAAIDNLAAVPPVLFGLLGASLLISGLALPPPADSLTIGGGLGRGWPIVAGLVLAAMMLPVIMISARAALSRVSKPRREAALGLGATNMQAVIHHIIPAAAPGMFTGALIAVSQALGQTAPLLIVGMLVFVADVPSRIDEPATTLPVLIYKWSMAAEPAFETRTAAAIAVLLGLVLMLNLVAMFLRWRLER